MELFIYPLFAKGDLFRGVSDPWKGDVKNSLTMPDAHNSKQFYGTKDNQMEQGTQRDCRQEMWWVGEVHSSEMMSWIEITQYEEYSSRSIIERQVNVSVRRRPGPEKWN